MSTPTLKVELDLGGFINGAMLDDAATANLDSAVLGPTVPTFPKNITAYVREASTARGAQRELQRVEAGTASLTLSNRDGRFTPFNSASPYYPFILPMRRIRIRAGFTDVPELIAGLGAWYDFSDISTLFQDTARTSPITATGQEILGVTDKSGAGAHMSEATTGPIYTTGIQNGRSVARFTANTDTITATPYTWGAASTLFMVAKKRTAPSASSVRLINIGLNVIYSASGESATDYRFYRNQALATVTLTGATANAWGILTLAYASDSSLEVFYNGTSVVTMDPDNHAGSGRICLANEYEDGTSGGDMDYAEFVAYPSTAISSIDRSRVEHYLGSKWGITVA